MEIVELEDAVVFRPRWDGTIHGFLFRGGVRLEVAAKTIRFWRGLSTTGRRAKANPLPEADRVELVVREWASGHTAYQVYLAGPAGTMRVFASFFHVEAHMTAGAFASRLGLPLVDATSGLPARVLADRLPSEVARAFGFSRDSVSAPAAPDGLEVEVGDAQLRVVCPPLGHQRFHTVALWLAAFIGPLVAATMVWRMQGLPGAFVGIQLVQAILVTLVVALGPVAATLFALGRAQRKRDVFVLQAGRVVANETFEITLERLETLELESSMVGAVPGGPMDRPVLFIGTDQRHDTFGFGSSSTALAWLRAAILLALNARGRSQDVP